MSGTNFPRHKLRLILSVDMVGSTPFKQGQEKTVDSNVIGAPWFGSNAMFYSEVPSNFFKQWEQVCSNLNPQDSSLTGKDYPPVFWKAAGDEIFYWKELTDYRQAVVCLYAWRKAINKSREELKDKFKLDLKSTAWIANFPTINTEVVLELNKSQLDLSTQTLILPSDKTEQETNKAVLANLARIKKYEDPKDSGYRAKALLDFVGPSIDNGFRLTKFASPRKLIVSIGLAWMLAEGLKDLQSSNNPRVKEICEGWRFYYDGGEVLKGIRSGNPYPVFWIDEHYPNPKRENEIVVEDRLLGRCEAKLEDISSFVDLTIQGDKKHLTPPFIDPERCLADDKFKLNSNRKNHNEHIERIAGLRKLWEDNKDKVKDFLECNT